jgi:hypothetical protein
LRCLRCALHLALTLALTLALALALALTFDRRRLTVCWLQFAVCDCC